MGKRLCIGLKTFLVIIVLCFILFNYKIVYFRILFCTIIFTRQDIKDPILDWIDVENQTSSYKGDPSTDIT